MLECPLFVDSNLMRLRTNVDSQAKDQLQTLENEFVRFDEFFTDGIR